MLEHEKYGHLFDKTKCDAGIKEIIGLINSVDKEDQDRGFMSVLRLCLVSGPNSWNFFKNELLDRSFYPGRRVLLENQFDIAEAFKEKVKEDIRYRLKSKPSYWGDPYTGETFQCRSNDPYLIYDRDERCIRLVKDVKDGTIDVWDEVQLKDLYHKP